MSKPHHPSSDVTPMPAAPMTDASATWLNPVSGDWSTGASWSTGAAPTASTDVTIAAMGTYTIVGGADAAAHSIKLNTAGVTLDINDSLALGGDLTVQQGTFVLGQGAVLAGGTIGLTSAYGTITLDNGGTLSGVTVGLIELDANKSGGSLHLANHVAIANAFVLGGPVSETLFVDDNETFAEGSILLGTAIGGVR